MIEAERCGQNPLITAAQVVPSRKDLKVEGIFNCGVARYQQEVILLCRVAESVVDHNENVIGVPMVCSVNGEDKIEIVSLVKAEHPELDFSDKRVIKKQSKDGMKTVLLTSLSHLRIARSRDGIHFTVDHKPFVVPNAEEESWGMEDPRITQIDDTYFINYTSVTENGAATSLISTKDFCHYERHGVIFAPENKDVTIFPEKINGMYVAFNRPVPNGIGDPQMWLAQSPDLLHWGNQSHFCGISDADGWDNGRIGGGAVPFKTERGWVKIYHGADRQDRYCLGAFLLDMHNPGHVLAKTREPILQPEMDYETHGFFGNVVFTCGCLVDGDMVSIYYGAADDKICRADIRLSDIFSAMEVTA